MLKLLLSLPSSPSPSQIKATFRGTAFWGTAQGKPRGQGYVPIHVESMEVYFFGRYSNFNILDG